MEIALERPPIELNEIMFQIIQVIGVVLSVLVAWVLKWAKAHFESQVMRDSMYRLNDTVQNGISYAVTQGQELHKGRTTAHRTKSTIINTAMVYARDHSAELIKASGYSDDKLRELIESKLPEIQNRVESQETQV